MLNGIIWFCCTSLAVSWFIVGCINFGFLDEKYLDTNNSCIIVVVIFLIVAVSGKIYGYLG